MPYKFIYQSDIEEDIYITGSLEKINNWNPNNSPKLTPLYSDGKYYYQTTIYLSKDEFPFEYKYLIKDNGKINWIGKPYENIKIEKKEYEKIYKDITENKIYMIDLNIRYENFYDGINNWNNRKESLMKILKQYDPDIIFLQETTDNQNNYIFNELKINYIFLGENRDNSSHSERNNIIYNKNKFDLISNGQFWLSSTPEIPFSNDFKNIFPRICTWSILRYLNGKKFLLFNTHLDHINMNAHLPSIKIILNKIKDISNNFSDDIDLIIFGGCFYCEENDIIINEICNFGFVKINFNKTFHNFIGNAIYHWDYLFYYKNNKFNVDFSKVIDKESIIDQRKNIFVSDHFPVFVQFESI